VTNPPLREPTFFILSALTSGPSHGYGLIQEVEKLSKGRVKLRAGTLYGALDRLAQEGLIGLQSTTQDAGPVRTNYRLTSKGLRRLQDEIDRLDANLKMARARVRLARS
jgi:DNA-binding PadR family transcriptional regulator